MERTDLHTLDPVTVQHHDYYLVKTEDPSRNMVSIPLLQEAGGNGGERTTLKSEFIHFKVT